MPLAHARTCPCTPSPPRAGLTGVVIDGAIQHHDALLEQPREDVIGTLPTAACLLNHDGHVAARQCVLVVGSRAAYELLPEQRCQVPPRSQRHSNVLVVVRSDRLGQMNQTQGETLNIRRWTCCLHAPSQSSWSDCGHADVKYQYGRRSKLGKSHTKLTKGCKVTVFVR